MTEFQTMMLPEQPTVVAPDGSDVRVLLALPSASMAHFTLASNCVSQAISHRTVEEIWYVVSGRGEMWRKSEHQETIVELVPGVCLTLPVGTHFQFRAGAAERLSAIGITLPPWSDDTEAELVAGPWIPS